MAFTKGTAANPNGRPKGSKNKSSEMTRKAFEKLIHQNLPNLNQWLSLVAKEDPKAAMDIIAKLAEYILPKLARVHQEVDTTEKKQFTIIDMSTWD